MLTRRRFLEAAGLASALPLCSSAVTAADPSSPRGTLLLVDDHHVLYRPGTRRVLQPLRRYPRNPRIAGRDKPWEIAIAWSSVHRDPTSGRYQLWYQAFAGPAAREKTHRCTVCYAESADGLTWHKPALSLHRFNDVKDTNIVLLANGGTSDRYGVSVVVDPRDPDPDRRYKMVYFDFVTHNGREYPGMCVAFSPDGVHWTKHPDGPVLRASYGNPGEEVPYRDDPKRPWAVPLSISDATDVFYDPRLGVFAAYGKCWIDGPDGRIYWKHAACRSQSSDFVHWDPPQLVMTPDEHDPRHVEFHTTPVFYHAGVYFAAPQILNRSERGGVMDVELAISRDGINFQRPFRKPFWLPRSDGDAFDSGSLFTNSSPVMLADEMRFYYGGYSQGATGADDSKQVSGIGLATLPRDRFASLEPIADVGQVTLKPIELSGVSAITLNADASGGSVIAELLDAGGYRVRGFTRETAVPITGDSLRHPVQWAGTSLRELPSGAYMLRLVLQRAKLFGVAR
jgi:hypothetical protein